MKSAAAYPPGRELRLNTIFSIGDETLNERLWTSTANHRSSHVREIAVLTFPGQQTSLFSAKMHRSRPIGHP